MMILYQDVLMMKYIVLHWILKIDVMKLNIFYKLILEMIIILKSLIEKFQH